MDIIFENVYKAYRDKEVLRDCNLVFPEGEITALMGPSGCGKTTILRLIMGLEKADKGTIQGLENKKLSVVFQEDRLCEVFTAPINILMTSPKKVTREEVTLHVEEIGLKDILNKPVAELSGGMKRRVAIVRAILSGGDLILLDEPFKGLDKDNLKLVCDYIKNHRKNATVIMVTHSHEEGRLLGVHNIIDLS